MRQIPATSSLLVYLDALDYTEAALLAELTTHDLAKPITQEIKEWDAIFQAERLARRDTLRAEAVVAVRGASLDAAVVAFGSQAVASAGGDRKGTFFRRFFNVAPSSLVKQSLAKHAQNVIDVVTVEAAKLEKDHPLHKLGLPLKKLAQSAIDALDARRKVKAARASNTHDEEEWKEGVNRLLLSTYAELLHLAAETGHSKVWASAFFPSHAVEAASDAPTPPVSPAPPTTTPAPAQASSLRRRRAGSGGGPRGDASGTGGRSQRSPRRSVDEVRSDGDRASVSRARAETRARPQLGREWRNAAASSTSQRRDLDGVDAAADHAESPRSPASLPHGSPSAGERARFRVLPSPRGFVRLASCFHRSLRRRASAWARRDGQGAAGEGSCPRSRGRDQSAA